MHPSILVTAPNFDMMTRYLSTWAEIFIGEAEARGNAVYVLRSTDANETKFKGYIEKNKPEVIFINGHGGPDWIAGHENEVILNMDSADCMSSATVYALSCQSSLQLGPAAVSAGAKGYLGYEQDFILISNPHKTARPNEDETAALFLEPSKAIMTSLSKGHNVDEAYEKGWNAYSDSIQKALNSDVQSDDDKFVPYLLWNRFYLSKFS